jgi:adenylate cyclase
MSYTFQIGASSNASYERLAKLIQERLAKGADKKDIDARIWDLFGEHWTVMFTDLSGFSRQVAKFGIIHFLQVIHESQRLLVPCIDNHDGILLKMEGDSMMVIFKRPIKAAACAIEMQQVLRDYNKDKTAEEKVLICIGLGYGEMLRIGDNDIFGSEVNAASKLGEDIADAEEILVTESVKDDLTRNSQYKYEKIKSIPPGAKAAYKLFY